MDHNQYQRWQAGIEICQHIYQQQQLILKDSDEIETNDPRMWQDCLDQLDNDHWELIFEVLAELDDTVFLRPHQQRLIQDAMQYYVKHKNRSDRAMDINPKYKKPSWGCCMAIREIWQDIINRKI
jgi:hypothetical protein